MTQKVVRRGRARIRATGVAAIALMLAVMTAQPTAAHQVEQTTTWYGSNTPTCQHGYSRLGHGNGNGHVYMRGQAVKDALDLDCWFPLDLPAGSVFAKWRLFKWTGLTWALCNQGGGVHNESGDNEAISWWDLPTGNALCGPGAYSNFGETWHEPGGGHVGGTLPSGSHQLPTF